MSVVLHSLPLSYSPLNGVGVTSPPGGVVRGGHPNPIGLLFPLPPIFNPPHGSSFTLSPGIRFGSLYAHLHFMVAPFLLANSVFGTKRSRYSNGFSLKTARSRLTRFLGATPFT